MLNIKKLPSEVVDALRNRHHTDGEIEKLTPEEAFDEYCMWHGLIDWGPTLRRLIEGTVKAQMKR